MLIENIFGYIAFFTSIIGLLPQVYKSIKTRSTHDISMAMLINYLICSLAWVVYGGYANSMFVLSSNILGLLSSVALVFIKLYFDKEPSDVTNIC